MSSSPRRSEWPWLFDLQSPESNQVITRVLWIFSLSFIETAQTVHERSRQQHLFGRTDERMRRTDGQPDCPKTQWLRRHSRWRRQWRKSGCNSGSTQTGSRRLGCGERWGGYGERLCPILKMIFTWTNGVFWCILSALFVRVLARKIVEFSAWSGDLVDVEDVLCWNSALVHEYSVRIMGLISFLMHYCIVIRAICCLEFWNMTKSGDSLH